MATITIRVSEDEKNFLKYMSEFMNLSLTDLIKNYTIEDLEDLFDTHVADTAYAEWSKHKQTIPHKDVMKEFGLL
ncbi:type II toxin-antitoxin system RelB family antitoxin [Macrococcus animalis]|uniref:type II toxin-antitoxin system RelB family antitoxin n=1 Tax=Macrococcus animalis TaxID=3395467 RepID=UPI0039BFD944